MMNVHYTQKVSEPYQRPSASSFSFMCIQSASSDNVQKTGPVGWFMGYEEDWKMETEDG